MESTQKNWNQNSLAENVINPEEVEPKTGKSSSPGHIIEPNLKPGLKPYFCFA